MLIPTTPCAPLLHTHEVTLLPVSLTTLGSLQAEAAITLLCIPKNWARSLESQVVSECSPIITSPAECTVELLPLALDLILTLVVHNRRMYCLPRLHDGSLEI